jgi:hypothetical protein
MSSALPPPTLLDRLKAVVRRVAGLVRERGRVVPLRAPTPVAAAVSPELRGLAKEWLATKLRALSALSALMRRIEAGDVLARPVGLGRAPARCVVAEPSTAEPVVRAEIAPAARLPRGFGWMCAFGPDVRTNGAAFGAWLNQPWPQALVMAAPGRMARLIGPILTATGENRPDWFPKQKPRGKAAPRADETRNAAETAATSSPAPESEDTQTRRSGAVPLYQYDFAMSCAPLWCAVLPAEQGDAGRLLRAPTRSDFFVQRLRRATRFPQRCVHFVTIR